MGLRLVARNGVVCVDSQHISVGKHYNGSTCDVLVRPGPFQFWVGNELLKTVARTSAGEIRKAINSYGSETDLMVLDGAMTLPIGYAVDRVDRSSS